MRVIGESDDMGSSLLSTCQCEVVVEGVRAGIRVEAGKRS